MSYENLVQDQESRLVVQGYKYAPIKQYFIKFLCIICFPVLPLALYWKRDWWSKLAFKKSTLQTATHVLIQRGELIDLLPINIIKGQSISSF